MIEIQKEWAQFQFGVWPEDLDCDGALKETAGALDSVVSTWIDLRTRYRETMTDLTITPFGRVKAAGKHAESRFQAALSRLDKARQAVNRELSELDRKHTPKLGNLSDTMLDVEVRTYLRGLPETEMTKKLLEVIAEGDLLTLRAVLLARPVLLSIPAHVLAEIKTAYARTLDPEGFERRELLDKALGLLERSGRKFMGEVHNLLPPSLVNALSNDKGAAARAEKLADAEFKRAQTESRVLGAEAHPIPPLSERMAVAAAEMEA
jgi:hypothetical protein